MVIITVKIAMIKIQMISLLGPPIESNTLIALSYNVYNYANFIMHYNRVISISVFIN